MQHHPDDAKLYWLVALALVLVAISWLAAHASKPTGTEYKSIQWCQVQPFPNAVPFFERCEYTWSYDI